MLGYENVEMEGPRVGECIVVPYINLHTIFDCACDFFVVELMSTSIIVPS